MNFKVLSLLDGTLVSDDGESIRAHKSVLTTLSTGFNDTLGENVLYQG